MPHMLNEQASLYRMFSPSATRRDLKQNERTNDWTSENEEDAHTLLLEESKTYLKKWADPMKKRTMPICLLTIHHVEITIIIKKNITKLTNSKSLTHLQGIFIDVIAGVVVVWRYISFLLPLIAQCLIWIKIKSRSKAAACVPRSICGTQRTNRRCDEFVSFLAGWQVKPSSARCSLPSTIHKFQNYLHSSAVSQSQQRPCERTAETKAENVPKMLHSVCHRLSVDCHSFQLLISFARLSRKCCWTRSVMIKPKNCVRTH